MAKMTAVYILMVEAAKWDWRKLRITSMEQCVGSCFCAWHHSEKKLPSISIEHIGGRCQELQMICTTAGSYDPKNGDQTQSRDRFRCQI